MSAGAQPAPGTLTSRWAHLCLTLGLVQGTQSIVNRERAGTADPRSPNQQMGTPCSLAWPQLAACATCCKGQARM